MAEANTLCFGLNFAQSFGCSRLIINYDVIAAMQDGGTFSGLAALFSTIVIIWLAIYHKSTKSTVIEKEIL